MSQILLKLGQSEPQKNLVESIPVKEETKLLQNEVRWEDLRGLF